MRLLLVFGATLCAIATAPTRAYADALEIGEINLLLVSEYPTTSVGSVDASYLNSHYLDYMVRAPWVTNDDIVTPVTGGSLVSAYEWGKEFYWAGNFASYSGVSGLINNPAMSVMMQYNNDIILKGESFKVNFRNKTIYRRAGPEGGQSTYDWTLDAECSCSISRVFVGQNMANLQQVTATNGLYTAPVNVRYIVFVLSVGGRSATGFLRSEHGYMFLERPSVIVYTPDPVTTQQTLDQTNSINSTIENSTQEQTETLVSTNGSNGIVSGVADSGITQVENLSLAQAATHLSEHMVSTMNTSEEDSTVVFPGLNLMGFTIPAAEIDVWDYFPVLHTPVRVIVTFIFCTYFIRHIIGLLDLIFGIASYVTEEVPDYEVPQTTALARRD